MSTKYKTLSDLLDAIKANEIPVGSRLLIDNDSVFMDGPTPPATIDDEWPEPERLWDADDELHGSPALVLEALFELLGVDAEQV